MNKNEPELLVRVPLTVGVVVVVVGLMLAVSVAVAPDTWQDRLRSIIMIIAGSGTVYAAFYAGAALRSNIARDRIHRAFEMLAAQNTSDFVTTFHYLESVRKKGNPKGAIDWATAINQEPELEQSLRLVLASFEDMAIAVWEGYIDERMVYLANGQVMPMCLGLLRRYVDHVREQRLSKGYMCALDNLCQCWAKFHYSTGRPIDPPDRITVDTFYYNENNKPQG